MLRLLFCQMHFGKFDSVIFSHATPSADAHIKMYYSNTYRKKNMR